MPYKTVQGRISKKQARAVLSGGSVKVYVDGKMAIPLTEKQIEKVNVKVDTRGRKYYKAKFSSKHLRDIEGSGFFDWLKKAVGSVYAAGKKGVKWAQEHKAETSDFLDKLGSVVPQLAPFTAKAKEIKTKLGMGIESESDDDEASPVKRAVRPKRKMSEKQLAWVNKLKTYSAKHKCTYKQAMIACAKSKSKSGAGVSRASGIFLP
jgi:hypothetical protein